MTKFYAKNIVKRKVMEELLKEKKNRLRERKIDIFLIKLFVLPSVRKDINSLIKFNDNRRVILFKKDNRILSAISRDTKLTELILTEKISKRYRVRVKAGKNAHGDNIAIIRVLKK